jgi:outer membrane protein OmpA-like peptidoglycan-associated protein/Tol biopolymer transport system component
MKQVLKIVSFLLCFFTVFTMQAQVDYSTKNKKAIKNYEEAIKYFQDRKLEEAKKYLEKSITEDDKFVEAHMTLSYVYGDMQQYDKAISEIKYAISIKPDFFPGNYFLLAQLEMKIAKYTDAKQHFEQFLSSKPDNMQMKKSAQKELINCDFAIDAIEHPVPFSPVNVGNGLNSQYDEYYPSITADEQTFLFTRKLPTDKNRYGFQEDFYLSDKVNGVWANARSIGTQINTENNEGAPCLSADGQILFFVACEMDYGYGANRTGMGSCDIFYSYRNGNDWSVPKNVGQPVSTKWWETQPSFSSDGKTLYFIRGTVNANGENTQDIYTSTLRPDGKWTVPAKLSNKINTSYNEESVFIHPDNQTLYFSSDGRPGMGGLDIYMSRRQPNGEWGEPVNLGYPINTAGDENSLLVSRDGETAWFASDRKGGFGGLDIYSFDLYEKVQPGKTIYVKGKVYDAITKAPLETEVESIDLQSGEVAKWQSSKKNGEFLICLPLNRNYAFNTSKAGYLFHSENFSLTENKDYKPILINIPLFPITKDSSVILKNVFFDTDKFDLKDESKIELNKLVEFLTKNSTIKIEIGGHTDNVGDKKHNMQLSDNRAKSVLGYLTTNGVSKDRVTAKGYGDTRPVVKNDSDENRQMNRRTEFKIITQ